MHSPLKVFLCKSYPQIFTIISPCETAQKEMKILGFPQNSQSVEHIKITLNNSVEKT